MGYTQLGKKTPRTAICVMLVPSCEFRTKRHGIGDQGIQVNSGRLGMLEHSFVGVLCDRCFISTVQKDYESRSRCVGYISVVGVI